MTIASIYNPTLSKVFLYRTRFGSGLKNYEFQYYSSGVFRRHEPCINLSGGNVSQRARARARVRTEHNQALNKSYIDYDSYVTIEG